MFEPEAIESLQISTASSGCKFYHRVSWPGKTGHFDSAVRFGCSFFKESYEKKEDSDDEDSRPIKRRASRHLDTCGCKAAIILHGTEVQHAPQRSVLFGFRLNEKLEYGEDKGSITRDRLFQYVSEHVPESRNAVQVHHMNNAGKRCLKMLLIFDDIHQASELISPFCGAPHPSSFCLPSFLKFLGMTPRLLCQTCKGIGCIYSSSWRRKRTGNSHCG